MKTKNLIFGLMIFAGSTSFLMQSCNKSDEGSISATDLSLAQDEAYIDAMYQEVDNVVSAELTSLDASGYSTAAKKSSEEDVCYTVTVDHPDSTNFPKIVTIDFGDGCTTVFKGDTIVRQGQIITTVTGRWFTPGSQHIITFNNFFMNGVKIEGTKTNTNLGINNQRHLMMGTELENGKVIFNDTVMATREASHVREIIRTFNPQNDTILVTGSAHGINVMGEDYIREIIEPLVLIHCTDYKWRWVIADGLVNITNSATGTTTLDYSGGGCDGTVIVNKNGYRHNYDFKYRHNNHNKNKMRN